MNIILYNHSLSPPSVWVFVHNLCITFSTVVPSSGCLTALRHNATNTVFVFFYDWAAYWVVICCVIYFNLSFNWCTYYKMQNTRKEFYLIGSSPPFLVVSKHPHAYSSFDETNSTNLSFGEIQNRKIKSTRLYFGNQKKAQSKHVVPVFYKYIYIITSKKWSN